MTTVFEISMSLDGYVTAAGVRPEEPMGDGGQQLHEWAFGADERGREVLAESMSKAGASIAGRRTYDLSVPWWGPDGPGGEARTPTFIVSHGTPEQVPEGSVYTFVNNPLEALELAAAAAGDKDVDVFSASIGRQLLRADRIDEIHVHLVPVLFGAGTRLFENLGGTHVQLEIVGVGEGSTATHLRYAVVAAPQIPDHAGHYQAQGGRLTATTTPSCSQAGRPTGAPGSAHCIARHWQGSARRSSYDAATKGSSLTTAAQNPNFTNAPIENAQPGRASH